MKDVEDALKNMDFSRLSKIKARLLAEMLEQRRLERKNKLKDLDLDELDQVVAAKGEDWRLKNR